MQKFPLILLIFFLLISFQTVSAQKKSKKKAKPMIINCGVCNQKAIFLPKPEYPSAAQIVRAEGKVEVEILIDEKGNVESVKTISGNPLLRASAEKAALQAKFEPFKFSSGEFAKVRGVIVYNFVFNPSDEKKKEEAFIETIPLGVLNDKALKIWFPKSDEVIPRPAEEIYVQVTINLQEGRVMFVKVPLLSSSIGKLAEIAAFQTTFQPILTEFPRLYGTGILIFKTGDFTGKTVENKNPKPVLPVITGGIMNGAGRNLAKPEFTEEAKKACANGKVEILTLIYMATGKVISAKAISGNELLRKSAEDAVMKSTFSVPNIDGDKNVYVKGKIIYNFVPEKDCEK